MKAKIAGRRSGSNLQLAMLTEGAVRVAVHRMRRRMGELLRGEITRTTANEQEAEEEVRQLFATLGS